MYNFGASMTDSSHPKPVKKLDEAEARAKFKPKRQLAGSAALICDLERASTEISTSIFESIAKSADEFMH
jgi:hypothetical protein